MDGLGVLREGVQEGFTSFGGSLNEVTETRSRPIAGRDARSRILGMTVSASILLGEGERIVHEPAIHKLPFAKNHKIAHINPDSSQASPNHGNLICCIRPRLVDVFRDLSRAQATTPHTVDDRAG